MPVSRINALRPSTVRPKRPDNLPADVRAEMKFARESGTRVPALLDFVGWRYDVLMLEQGEMQKIETLCWMWRAFAGSDDEALRVDGVALVRRVLAKAWGIELPAEPPDFGAARKIAADVARRIEDLPMAWRFA